MKNKLLGILLAVSLLCGISEYAVAEWGGEGAFGSIINYLKHVGTNIIPSKNSTYDLGSTLKKWKDAYFDTTIIGDITTADSTPSLGFNDTDSNVGYMWHLDSAEPNWANLQLWRGTYAGNAFSVNPDKPLLQFDNSNNFIYQGGTFKADTITSVSNGAPNFSAGVNTQSLIPYLYNGDYQRNFSVLPLQYTWTKSTKEIPCGGPTSGLDINTMQPYLMRQDGIYYVFYEWGGAAPTTWSIGLAYATSLDGPWTYVEPLLTSDRDSVNNPDYDGVADPSVLYIPWAEYKWHMWFDQSRLPGASAGGWTIGHAYTNTPTVAASWIKQATIAGTTDVVIGGDTTSFDGFNNVMPAHAPEAFLWGGVVRVIYSVQGTTPDNYDVMLAFANDMQGLGFGFTIWGPVAKDTSLAWNLGDRLGAVMNYGGMLYAQETDLNDSGDTKRCWVVSGDGGISWQQLGESPSIGIHSFFIDGRTIWGSIAGQADPADNYFWKLDLDSLTGDVDVADNILGSNISIPLIHNVNVGYYVNGTPIQDQFPDATLTYSGTAKSNRDYLTISNTTSAADMDGTGAGIKFKLEEVTGGTLVNAGGVSVTASQDWTSTASTQDSNITLQNTVNGSLADVVLATVTDANGLKIVLGDGVYRTIIINGGDTHNTYSTYADHIWNSYDGSGYNTRMRLYRPTGNLLVGSTDDDGTPATGRGVFQASTNDGTTNAIVGRDSDGANIATLDSNGNGTLVGTFAVNGDTITCDSDLTLDPAGNDILLDNASLTIPTTYDLIFGGAGTITHQDTTTTHYTETFNNDADTGWWWYNTANNRILRYNDNGVSMIGFSGGANQIYAYSIFNACNLTDYATMSFTKVNGANGTIATSTLDILLDPAGSDLLIDATGPNYAADGGSTDAYAITLTGITIKTGMVIYFKANTLNTGACTLNINAVGAVSLKSLDDQDPADSYIEAGSMVQVIYDGTNYQILSPDANP